MEAEFDGWTIARQRIAKEARERTGKLDLAGLGLEELPPEVAELTHLRELDLGWRQWETLNAKGAIESINRQYNLVVEIRALAALKGLQVLNCSGTSVIDLAPLARLTTLQVLDCSDTNIADLAPLAALTALRSLRCDRTKLTDLSQLHDFPALKEVYANSLRLCAISRIWVESERAAELVLWMTYIRDIPSVILSHLLIDDCLPAMRAYSKTPAPTTHASRTSS